MLVPPYQALCKYQIMPDDNLDLYKIQGIKLDFRKIPEVRPT